MTGILIFGNSGPGKSTLARQYAAEQSLDEQNRNLEMLAGWIRQYPTRHDEFSLTAYEKLFADFSGRKAEYRSNERDSL